MVLSLWARVGVFLTLPVMFSCTHWPTPVPTWPEQSAPDEVSRAAQQSRSALLSRTALLRVPGHLQLIRVDGRTVPEYLMQSVSFDFLLLPGERELEVRYDSLWAKGLEGGSRRIRSRGLTFTVAVEEGGRYSLQTQSRPESADEAQAMALCPRIRLENAGGEVLARAGDGEGCEEKRR